MAKSILQQSYGGGGLGWWRAVKWWAKATSTLKTTNDIHWCHFQLHVSHKIAKPIRQSCGELQLAVCLSRGVGAIYRPHKHSWTSNKPQKQARTKAARVTFNTSACQNCWLLYPPIVWWWKVCLAVVQLCVCRSGLFKSSHICIWFSNMMAQWYYNFTSGWSFNVRCKNLIP